MGSPRIFVAVDVTQREVSKKVLLPAGAVSCALVKVVLPLLCPSIPLLISVYVVPSHISPSPQKPCGSWPEILRLHCVTE